MDLPLLALQIDIVCLVVLGSGLVLLHSYNDSDTFFFARLNIKAGVLCGIDAAYYVICYLQPQLGRYGGSLVVTAALAFYAWIVWMPYTALLDGMLLFCPRRLRRDRAFAAYSVLFWVTEILIISSPWHGKIFFLDYDGAIETGAWFWWLWAVFLVYQLLIFADPRVHPGTRLHTEGRHGSDFVLSAACALLPAAALPGDAYLDLPLVAPALTVAMFWMLVKTQENRVSTDDLTGINNRTELMRHLNRLYLKPEELPEVTVMFIDVNGFKRINDVYGHAEGDRALTVIAGLLKKAAGEYNAMVARYGGDEFVLVFRGNGEREIARCTTNLKRYAQERTVDLRLPYQLSLSIGTVHWLGEYDTPKKLLAVADNVMYEVKQEYYNSPAARASGNVRRT